MRAFCAYLCVAILFALTGCATPASVAISTPQATVSPTLPVVPAADPNATPVPTPEPRIILDERTRDVPYPIPKLVAESLDHADLTEDMLNALAERFCYDLFAPAQTLTASDFSQYAQDNASTHLALRWGEYLMADAKKFPHKRIVKFTSIRSEHSMRENHDDFVLYRAMCEVRYDRTDPSVNGCNVDITMTVAEREGVAQDRRAGIGV